MSLTPQTLLDIECLGGVPKSVLANDTPLLRKGVGLRNGSALYPMAVTVDTSDPTAAHCIVMLEPGKSVNLSAAIPGNGNTTDFFRGEVRVTLLAPTGKSAICNVQTLT